jgi:undecaprenyl pyrophosphate synthase
LPQKFNEVLPDPELIYKEYFKEDDKFENYIENRINYMEINTKRNFANFSFVPALTNEARQQILDIMRELCDSSLKDF